LEENSSESSENQGRSGIKKKAGNAKSKKRINKLGKRDPDAAEEHKKRRKAKVLIRKNERNDVLEAAMDENSEDARPDKRKYYILEYEFNNGLIITRNI